MRETSYILENNIRLLNAALYNDMTYLRKQTPISLIQAGNELIKNNSFIKSDKLQGFLALTLIENVKIDITNSIVEDKMGSMLPTI